LDRQHPNRRDPDDRVLLLNLYVTQGLVLGLALLIIWLGKGSVAGLFAVRAQDAGIAVVHAMAVAALVLAADGMLSRLAPGMMKDESGIDEKLFAGRPLAHVAFICLMAAVSEELLFRGALQPLIGNFWTSALFAAIHVRYLRHWLPTLTVFAASLALGWAFARTGTLVAPVTAHFLIDMVNGYMLRRKSTHG
jgi:hypothetical protein